MIQALTFSGPKRTVVSAKLLYLETNPIIEVAVGPWNKIFYSNVAGQIFVVTEKKEKHK